MKAVVRKSPVRVSTIRARQREAVPETAAISFDILKQPLPDSLPKPSRLKLGVHISTSGGVSTAIERAVRIGANTVQIFSSSPRMWRGQVIQPEEAARLRNLRKEHRVGPLVIHANYLVNCCSEKLHFRRQSVVALRGEVERALLLGAEYLVLHPGSWRGMTRHEGLVAAAETIAAAFENLPARENGLTLLIENTAGSEFSLGGRLEHVEELIERLRPHAPVAACLDTCHLHVAGYDIVSAAGWRHTVAEIESSIGCKHIRVWHLNDAKAARGSRLDRHQNIGEGTIGLAPFKRLLNDSRFSHCAFIAETPVDVPGDERRNLAALSGMVRPARPSRAVGPARL